MLLRAPLNLQKVTCADRHPEICGPNQILAETTKQLLKAQIKDVFFKLLFLFIFFLHYRIQLIKAG